MSPRQALIIWRVYGGLCIALAAGFGLGLWRGERLILVALLGHCVLWFGFPMLWWMTLGRDADAIFFWIPLLIYIPPVIAGIKLWKRATAVDKSPETP